MTASETTQNSSGPLNYDELVARIIRQHGSLPKSFQRVARYVIQNPNEIAFRSSKQIADRVDVQASTLVRFAQVFGYSGFSEMQLVFRARLASVLPAFSERVDAIAGLIGSTGAKAGTLRALATMAIAALQRAVETIDDQSIARAGELLNAATTVHILGRRRSFPIAAYLQHVLLTRKKDCRLIDDAEGLMNEKLDIIKSRDVFVAVSFRYHGRETSETAEALAARDIPIILITENPVCSFAKAARVILLCPEDERNFSNSIAAPLCVAQALSMTIPFPSG